MQKPDPSVAAASIATPHDASPAHFVTTAADAKRVAEKVMAELAAGVTIGEQEFSISASIGIAVYPGDGTNDHALMNCADAAMYTAKQDGRNTYRFSGGMA